MRSIAVLFVVCHHTISGPLHKYLVFKGYNIWAEALSSITGSGVALFFVLSGIVLLRPYLREIRLFNIKHYFVRRVMRLWPPFVVALALTGMLNMLMTLFPNWYSLEIHPAFNFREFFLQLFIINFGWVHEYNAAWWSLSIEVVFYIVAPIFVICLRKRRFGSYLFLFFASLVFSILSILVRAKFSINANLLSGLLQFFAYLPCFICGIILAKFEVKSPKIIAFIMVAGITLFAYSLRHPYGNIQAALGLIYFSFVAISFNKKSIINRLCSSPIMIWIGERSYSLFLIHFTAFYMVNYLLAMILPDRDVAYFILSRVFGLLMAFFLTILIFHNVERRFAKGLVTANYVLPCFRL